MATHSSILAWTIPWTEKPGGPQTIRLQRVRHDWSTEKPYLVHSSFFFFFFFFFFLQEIFANILIVAESSTASISEVEYKYLS